MEQGCYNYFTLSCDASAGDLRLPYLMRFYLDLARADRRSNGIASEKVTRGVSRYYEAVVAVLRPICQEAQFHAIFDVLKDRSSIELLMATAEDDDFVRDDWFSMWADLQGNVGDAHYRGLISDLFRPFASLSRRVYYCDTANQVVWTAVAFGSLTQAARSWQMGFYPAREAAPQTTESLAAPTSKAPLSAGPTEDAPQAADQAFSLSRKRLREPLEFALPTNARPHLPDLKRQKTDEPAVGTPSHREKVPQRSILKKPTSEPFSSNGAHLNPLLVNKENAPPRSTTEKAAAGQPSSDRLGITSDTGKYPAGIEPDFVQQIWKDAKIQQAAALAQAAKDAKAAEEAKAAREAQVLLEKKAQRMQPLPAKPTSRAPLAGPYVTPRAPTRSTRRRVQDTRHGDCSTEGL